MYNWVSNVRQFPLLSLSCKSCLQQITNLFAHSTAFESFAGEAAVDSVRLWVVSWCLTLLNGGRDVWSAETSTIISGTCFNMRNSSSDVLNCVGPPAFFYQRLITHQSSGVLKARACFRTWGSLSDPSIASIILLSSSLLVEHKSAVDLITVV